jgi:hypothetical protein
MLNKKENKRNNLSFFSPDMHTDYEIHFRIGLNIGNQVVLKLYQFFHGQMTDGVVQEVMFR